MAMMLPDHIVKKIADPIERKRHMSAQEASDKYARDTEREMHSKFSNYCALHDILFEHENPAKRSTSRPGWPDFRCFGPNGRVLFVEFKVRPNGLTKEQEEIRAALAAFGAAEYRYVVAYSLVEAIHAAQQHLLR
jgi:hypothetical protein